jgi:GxxExxY protein
MNLEERKIITGKILDTCIEVHRNLGPGLLESTYEICLMKEFTSRGMIAKNQVMLPISYKGELLDQNYRIDIFVEDEFILGIKSVESILPIHTAQTITYLKLAGKEVGFLINFNVPKMIDGFKRIIQTKNIKHRETDHSENH